MNNKWHHRFLDLACVVSTWSKDPSTKCGAVIVRPNRTIASVGYNGFPRGCDDSPNLYDDRDVKYSRVVHAEVNAILNCAERPDGYALYSWPPGWGPTCDRCAAVIIQSGIVRVVYHRDEREMTRWKAPGEMALKMYAEAGIEVIDVSGV